MTTTTTATPVPTAAAQTRAAPPRQNATTRPVVAKSEAENSALRFLIYLRLHWLTILFCGALLGCALAYAAWTLMPPKYESYALFQVNSAPPSISANNDPTRGKTEFVTYIKTTASLFRSPTVYNAALGNERMIDVPTIQAEKDPFKYLDEKLVVENKEGTEIIRLSIQGENPDDVQRIIVAITAAYLREVVQRESDVKTAILTQLQSAKTSLETIMKAKTSSRPDQAAGVVPGVAGAVPMPLDPMIPVTPAALNTDPVDPARIKQAMFPILIQQVAKLKTEFPAYDLNISEKKALFEATKKAIQILMDTPLSQESLDFAKSDPEYLRAQANAKHAREDYKHRFGSVNDPTSPGIKALERKAEQAEIDAKKILDERAKTVELAKRKPAFQELNQTLNYANNTILKLAEEKKIAAQQLASANKDLAETSFPAGDPRSPHAKKEPMTWLQPSEVDYMSHENLYQRVTAQLIAAEYDAKLPPRVYVRDRASPPMQKDTKKQIIAAVFAGLMGFALVGAFVVAYESRARKVSSLGEMKTACATPVVSVIPWVPNAATARDPIKRGDVNEAIDKLRAYFAQTWLNRGATTVTVTSALGDEGKSFTAFGLASSLAQAGYKTLLVDFDLREPSLHGYAGVPNTLGVCELLRGEADFRKTIQVLPNGLHFLPAGKWSDEARQAAVGGRLDALLLRLKEPFDCIVLHGHALLTAAEAVEVARRSEVVLLCAQYRESRIPLVKRAAERIATMEIPYSGIVYSGASTQEALC